jgi:hypothetical protein
MSDQANFYDQTPRCRSSAGGYCFLLLLVLTGVAVQGGSRRSAGHLPEGKIVYCPECGKKVRLGADGYGYCRKCRLDFDGSKAEEA